MRQKNKNQIIRFDGRNVFIEVMNTAFEISGNTAQKASGDFARNLRAVLP